MNKFLIKMMTDRAEGYKAVSYASTPEKAQELIKAYKVYYNPIDIYYMYA